MIKRALVLSVMLAGASLTAASPAFALDQVVEQSGTLPHGGSYVYSQDVQSAASAIDLWFRAPGAGYDFASPGIARLAATAAASTKLASGRSLVDFVKSVGGRLSINVYPDMLGISVVVPSSAARRTVATMTAAYFAAKIDDDSLKIAQRDAAVLAVEQRYSVDQTLHNLLLAALFPQGAFHSATLPNSAPEIMAISRQQVDAYATRAFRSQNAILSMAGNVGNDVLTAVTDGTPGQTPQFFDSVAAAPATTSASGSVSGIGLAWAGPPISDERAATAMDFIADYLFRDGGVIDKTLGDEADYVSGQFITLHNPGVMLVTIGGKNAAASRDKIAATINKLSTPLDAAAFAAAREAFIYHLAADTQMPQEEADNLGWYAVEGNPAYAPGLANGTYLKAARSLDAAFVASVAQKYLQHPTVVQLVSSSKDST